MSEIRDMTRTEAEALLRYLRDLPADRWDSTTVCNPWTVRHLVAHLTALNNQTIPNFARRMIRHGFNFQKVVDGDLRKYMGDRDEMLAAFEASSSAPKTPRALATIALGEFMVHGEDIRRALGDRGDHPAEHVAVVGPEYATSGKPLGGKVRTAGLSFRATDGDFVWGEGPEIAGPGIDLILAISGRGAALDTCSGPGVATLRERCGLTTDRSDRRTAA